MFLLFSLLIQAIQKANQRLSEGGSVEDAKAMCEPEIVKKVARWHVSNLCLYFLLFTNFLSIITPAQIM